MKRLISILGVGVCFAAAASGVGQSTRYKLEQRDGVWWIQGPAGERVFSFGVCCVEPGIKWERYTQDNPGYASWRFYLTKGDWAKAVIDRLVSGGFNTVGAWSDYRPLLDVPKNNLYMIPISHMGSSAGFPWVDMWDPVQIKICEDVCKNQIELLKKDRRVMGYFSDNEMGWWKPAMFAWVWKPKTNGTRTRVTDLLEAHYGRSWNKFTNDFEVVGAKSFADLRKKGQPFLRATGEGHIVLKKVLALQAERYYSLCRSIIKKHDPGALFFGDRFISNYYPEVAQIASKYCDVVSTNLNANWKDGVYARYHLESLSKITRKPLMITEYYMAAMQNRSGNKNSNSGFPTVETLDERAQGFTRTTTSLLMNPSVVGAHWFQYYDEPMHGRDDGENYNFGLVDINNGPYTELLAAAKAIDLNRVHSQARALPLPKSTLPPTPASPHDMTLWDRDHAYAPTNEEIAVGDLYASWSRGGVTVAMTWSEERFAEAYFRDDKIPNERRSTVEVEIPASGVKFKVRMDEKAGVRVQGPSWQFSASPNARSDFFVTIPASAFRKDSFAVGDKLEFNVRLVSRAGAYVNNWTVRRQLSGN